MSHKRRQPRHESPMPRQHKPALDHGAIPSGQRAARSAQRTADFCLVMEAPTAARDARQRRQPTGNNDQSPPAYMA